MRIERPQGYQPIFKGKKWKTPPYYNLDKSAKLAYLTLKYKGE